MGETHDDEDLGPSRSEKKRQSRGLQDLGWELVELPESELAAMPLPDDVRDAVEVARRITSHGALARQRLYIGKLLRRIDTDPIRLALDRRGAIDRQRVLREKAVERWRDRLLADDASAWTELGTEVDGPCCSSCGRWRARPGPNSQHHARRQPPGNFTAGCAKFSRPATARIPRQHPRAAGDPRGRGAGRVWAGRRSRVQRGADATMPQ